MSLCRRAGYAVASTQRLGAACELPCMKVCQHIGSLSVSICYQRVIKCDREVISSAETWSHASLYGLIASMQQCDAVCARMATLRSLQEANCSAFVCLSVPISCPFLPSYNFELTTDARNRLRSTVASGAFITVPLDPPQLTCTSQLPWQNEGEKMNAVTYSTCTIQNRTVPGEKE